MALGQVAETQLQLLAALQKFTSGSVETNIEGTLEEPHLHFMYMYLHLSSHMLPF